MYRIFFATSTMFISIVAGAVLLVYVGVNHPETLSMLLGWARTVKGAIIGSWGLAPKYNIWVDFLLQEQQLLFLFFTIIARIVLAIVTTFGAWLVGMPGYGAAR